MKTTIAVLTATLAATSFAESTPVMVSLVTPVQVPSRNYDVTGFRLSLLYGDCKNFKGFDLGVVQRTADDFSGLAIGGVNYVGERFVGAQVGLVNWCSSAATDWDSRPIGLQLGIVNYADSFGGLQDGLLNISRTSFLGWQDGPLNFAGDMKGLQSGIWLIGAINFASGNVNGVQVGLVNFANTMENGIQIGIVNIIANNGWLPLLPIINGGF